MRHPLLLLTFLLTPALAHADIVTPGPLGQPRWVWDLVGVGVGVGVTALGLFWLVRRYQSMEENEEG